MSKNKDFKFDKRASEYDDGFEGKLSKKFYKLLLNQVELNHGVKVLDVGCGTGTILKRMSDITDISGYGIDVEEKMINEAVTKCPEMNIFVSSCVKTPFENDKFDIITVCMAYHHFDDKKGFVKEMARIIKPNGCLYITDPRFPWIVRKPLNLALRIHKITGYFGTHNEISSAFNEYGFELVGVEVDKYAQCIKLQKSIMKRIM